MTSTWPCSPPAEGTRQGWRTAGSTFVGFYVESLDRTLEAVQRLGGEVLVDHEVRDWGCRIVVEDPDGRAVEINQRDHCDRSEPT